MNYHLYILTAYLPVVEIRLIQNDREETRTEELNCVGPSQISQVEGMGEAGDIHGRDQQTSTGLWIGGGLWVVSKEKEDREKRGWQGSCLLHGYSGFSTCCSGRARAAKPPALWNFWRECSSPFPWQSVEGPSQGWMEASTIGALMLVLCMTLPASGSSGLRRER